MAQSFITIITTGDQGFLYETRKKHDQRVNNYIKYGPINESAFDDAEMVKLGVNVKPVSAGGILADNKKMEIKSQSTNICLGRDFQEYIIITALVCEDEAYEEKEEG